MYNDTAAREAFGSALAAASHLQDQSEELCGQTRALVIIITALATLFVVLRFLGRYKHGMYIGADDWTCLLALVLLYVNFAVHLVLISMGVGMHTSGMTVDHIESLSKVLFAGELLYVTSINTYKISLLFFYWRTFPVRLMKIGGLLLGIFSVLWTFTAVFVISLQCLPVSKVWQPWAEGVCTELLHTEPAMASLNIACDIAILCLPLRPVLGLKINTAQKSFVIGTFLLGSYVCFTSCYRLAMFFKFDPNDPTYTLAEAQAWDVVEMASGIISACLPTLGPILKTMTNSFLTHTRLSRRMSAIGPARSSHGPKHDLNLVTIGGSGGSSCMSPRSPHWSMHDKYGAIDDADDEGVAGMQYAPPQHPPPPHPPPTPPTADILVTREVAVLMRKGASVSIARSFEDEAPLRKQRKSSLY
ncbi:integral membrane protein [Apiospora sp. TS-2023a]